MSFSRRSFLLGSASLVFALAAFAADPGVAADRIVFGQVAALEGAASALGLGMREGLHAAFAEANAKGGVKGRRLELVFKDDGYELNKSIEATTIDLDGAKLTFGPSDNQGMDEVFLTVIQKDGGFKAVKSLNGRSS